MIPWDEVSLDEGTGIVHIAPGCGAEDFELSRVHDLPVLDAGRRGGPLLRRLRLAARALDGRGGRADHRQPRGEGRLVEAGPLRAPLPRVLALPHAADLPHRRRLVHLGATSSASRCARRTATSHWTPEYMGKRMDDWLVNMGDWNISRRRYYGLPLPFYPCACGHLNVIGSQRGARASGPCRGLDQLEELRRPWIDRVPIRCEACGERGRADPRGRRRLARRRHRPVLDARLAEPGVGPGRLRDRAPRRA